MPLTKIELNNITVFHELSVEFNNGINVFLGENGVGKTHIMKLLYAACQAKKSEVTFPYKTVMVLLARSNSSIGRLVNRDVNSENRASVKVSFE
ncbi:MAG: AAA family ATPase [Oscillospiraceae bacterium]